MDVEEKVEKNVQSEERKSLEWPCYLQPHTCVYLLYVKETRPIKEVDDFLSKHCARFAGKLIRPTSLEIHTEYVLPQSDCLILASKYNPTTLLNMLPLLAPSCPFVVFSEHLEPLLETFRELQRQELAIYMRLSDTGLSDAGGTDASPNGHESERLSFTDRWYPWDCCFLRGARINANLSDTIYRDGIFLRK